MKSVTGASLRRCERVWDEYAAVPVARRFSVKTIMIKHVTPTGLGHFLVLTAALAPSVDVINPA